MSKGSRPRPFSISQEEFGNRMDGIFGKKPPKEPYVYKQTGQNPEQKQNKEEKNDNSKL